MTNLDECKALFDKMGVKYCVDNSQETGINLIIESPYWCAFEFNSEGKFIDIFITE